MDNFFISFPFMHSFKKAAPSLKFGFFLWIMVLIGGVFLGDPAVMGYVVFEKDVGF